MPETEVRCASTPRAGSGSAALAAAQPRSSTVVAMSRRGRKVDMTCPHRSYADEASRMTAKPLCRFSHPPAVVVDQQQVPQFPLLHLALPVHHGAAAAARQRNTAADRAAEATARTSASAQRPGTFRGPLRWSM